MAQKGYLKNPYVSLDGHDISSYVKGANVKLAKDQLEVTASGDGAHTYIPGLEKSQFDLNLYQDVDFSVLDRILNDVYNNTSPVLLEITPAGSTISEANPSYSAEVYLMDYEPLPGDVGTVLMTKVTLVANSVVTRAGT